MSFEELRPHIEFAGIDRLPQKSGDQPPRSAVVAIGHFGNFELNARIQDVRPDYQSATTYRALKHPAFNRLMQDLRARSGCLYFERRADGPLLRTAMNRGGVLLGLLTDQSSNGLRAPFLGHDCSTTLAPARVRLALSMRTFHRRLLPHRTGKMADRTRRKNSHARKQPAPPVRGKSCATSTALFEVAVRRDPANWFWVHRRWKD